MNITFRYLVSITAAFLCVSGSAWANDSRSMGPEIVEFLSQGQPSLSNSASISTEKDACITLIAELAESVYSFDAARLETAITVARSSPHTDSHELREALRFATGILGVFETNDQAVLKDNLIQYLETFDHGEDWYIESVSESLTGFLYITQNQLLDAAGHVSDAMHVIPSVLSPRVTSARLLAAEGALALHGMQGNPEFMLEAARVQRVAKTEFGEVCDRHETMTNFVYALNRARDYVGAAQVAELLMAEPRSPDAIPGLSDVYMAETFNEVGEYTRAKMLALSALQGSPHSVVEQRGHRELIVAHAGLGEMADAREIMAARGWIFSPAELLETVNKQSILHAEALIAMHRGESAYSLALMKRRADILIGRIQDANSGNMTAMLSNLENTHERQSEREEALNRETEMRAVQLEQKTKLNRMLWVLIGGLTIAFNFLLAFLRYREKLNVKVQGLQEDALSSEKMKTEFLGVINHELRTPLNGIIGISDAMIHHANSPVLREQAEAVQESGQLLFDLLDSLITMSTIEGDRLTLDKEAASLATTISREIAEWDGPATKKGLTFTHFIAPELNDNVISDHKRIRQCLHYLLSNAVRFTHTGRVHLHATAEPEEDGHITAKIIIADTGQGISEDVQSRLFQPFLQADATMTRKYGGAGLSLAIARKLARMMDGDLTVKSREGRGTEFTFSVRLPVARADVENVVDPALTGAANSLDEIEAIETPEEIIDLMLTKQLSGDVSPAAQTKQYKAAG